MCHVLLVDDDAEIRLVLRDALEEMGYTVHEAADGEQAIAAIHASAEALVILLDYWLPLLNGDAVFSASEGDPKLYGRDRYILISAGRYGVPPEFQRDVLARGGVVMRKPLELPALLEHVAALSERLARATV
jgi:CheY-like chemotaxis protein